VTELVFEITQDADGGFSGECLNESIFTQGDTWEELRANVK
jgi:predicted RNase H-like HicB family nuclease